MIEDVLKKVSEIRDGSQFFIFIMIKSEKGEYNYKNFDDKIPQLENELDIFEIPQNEIKGTLGEYPDSNFEISLIENCSEAEAMGVEIILKNASDYIDLYNEVGEWECKYIITSP